MRWGLTCIPLQRPGSPTGGKRGGCPMALRLGNGRFRDQMQPMGTELLADPLAMPEDKRLHPLQHKERVPRRGLPLDVLQPSKVGRQDGGRVGTGARAGRGEHAALIVLPPRLDIRGPLGLVEAVALVVRVDIGRPVGAFLVELRQERVAGGTL